MDTELSTDSEPGRKVPNSQCSYYYYSSIVKVTSLQGQGQGQGQAPGKPQGKDKCQDKAQGAGKGKDQGSAADAKKQTQKAAEALQQLSDGSVVQTDLGNVIDEVVNEAPKAPTYGSGSTPFFGKIPHCDPKGPVREPGADALSAGRRMGVKLEQLLTARVFEDDRLAYSGHLDGNQVSRVRLLDTQVFLEEEDECEGVDVAVMHLLDASSSMNERLGASGESRADVCFNVAYAATSAMSKFQSNGVNIAIWSYGSVLTKMVDFGRWTGQKKRFQQYLAAGGTAAFPAAVDAISELARQKQPRKHLIIYSDGDLGGEKTDEYLSEAQKAGIEVSIIFIGSKNIKPEAVSAKLKDRVYIVHDTPSVVSAMFECLKPRQL